MSHPRVTMLPKAEELAELFRPHCERIEIAGSLRRGKLTVKDIELVVVPILPLDLFGNPAHDLQAPLDALVAEMVLAGKLKPRESKTGRRIGMGQRFMALVYDDLPVDLFMVRPPAQWGAVFAIRTGPADFSKYLVTSCQSMGLRTQGGALRRGDGTILETPEEKDFFKACGVPWVPPEDRK